MAFYQLKSLFTGESAGGNFTLTGITTYPTTIFVYGVGNVTFNSSGDLPYTFPGGYNVSTEFASSAGGIYTIDYCVSGCTDPCSTTTLTILEKPVLGTTPTVTRCGVNGVYGNTSACFTGGITKQSDGSLYSDPLSYFSWSKDAWFQNSQCVTIPGSVTAGTINLQVASVAGPCGNTSTVQLVNVNIFAGAPNAKSYCWDKITYDSVKNLPAATNYNKDLTVLFNPVGQLVPSGTSDTWSFVSGPKVIAMITGKIAKFQDDVLEGTYIFKRTLQYGTCISEANFTIIIKFCSRGVLNTPLEKSCLLNTNVVMNTTYSGSYPAGSNVLSNSGCWLFAGNLYGGNANLDLEINGVLYTNYVIGCTFPYNSTIKITSAGKYDFVYTSSAACPGGCAPCGCVATNDAVSCGCPDGIITSSSFEGIFRINTLGVAPTIGSSQILAMGCGTRKASLFTTFNQLNGGGITAGGVWTYEGLADPITILVNGVSTTLNIGSVLSGSDPEIDLTGMPNPSNYSFKYTVTTTCGTAFRSLTVNITCNECTKVIDTSLVKTDCVSSLAGYHPTSFALNTYKLAPATGQSPVQASVLARITDCDGDNLDNNINIRSNTLSFSAIIGSSYQFLTGSYIKSMTFEGKIGGVKTLNLDPTNASPYMTGIAGTVTTSQLCYSHANRFVYAEALKKQIRNALYVEYGNSLITINFSFRQLQAQPHPSNVGATLYLDMDGQHQSPGEWVVINNLNFSATWSKGNGFCPAPDNHQTSFTANRYEFVSDNKYTLVASNYCGSLQRGINGYSFLGIINMATSTPFFYNLLLTQAPINYVSDPADIATKTCYKWNFATTITPACAGAATYSYKVGGSTIPDTTATFTRKTNATACNPFNSGLSQSLETTVGCDGCTGVNAYVKTTQTFC